MANEFDLERAKAGEPVEFTNLLRSPNPVLARVVGQSFDGNIIYIETWHEKFGWSDPERVEMAKADQVLRMAPKKVKVRYRVAIFGEGSSRWPVIINAHDSAADIPSNPYFVCWIHTDWQEVEVPQ